MTSLSIDQFLNELETLEKKQTNLPKDSPLTFENGVVTTNIIATANGMPDLSVYNRNIDKTISTSLFPISLNNCIPLFNDDTPDLLGKVRDSFTSVSLGKSDFQGCWARDVDCRSLAFKALLSAEGSAPSTTIQLEVDQVNHQLSMSAYKEIELNTNLNATNSTSLMRNWNESGTEFHRGDAQAFPFLPGGMEPAKPTATSSVHANDKSEPIDWMSFWKQPSQLLTKAPGLSHGLSVTTQQKQQQQVTSTSTFELIDEDEEEEEEEYEEEEYEEEVEEEEEEETKGDKESSETVDDSLDKVIGESSSSLENKLESLSIEEIKAKASEATTAISENVERKQWAFNDTKEITTPFKELITNPAIEYPFELDSFQKQAIYHMEKGDSVFISAHTSAGKTVIAEYAIAMAAKNMTRAIYTSPIKALSNQKFRDFKNTFSSVGLITGDVSVNPSAACLVLTTEILRSMLYKGADLIRDIEWVIFDEVHYLNDIDRGVVWEEVIIMLPAHVKIVLLSATVSNPLEFADWIGRTKKMHIYVIGTTKRPVPLEHYIHTQSNDLFKIVDSSRRFLSDGYNKAYASIFKETTNQPGGGNRGGGRGGNMAGGGGGAKRSSGWSKLIMMLKEKNQLPVIVFSFSKAKCQDYAFSLGSNVILTTSGERSIIKVFIEESLARLRAEDKELPQILQIRDFLERGIGVHHGGLLPIVKELVEILFSKSLVKVLFATETFAMGVNMPAKTVVYSHIRKHDGTQFRDLLPGEYTQMSGRAGRRGLDAVGTVILACWKDLPEQTTMESMILGVPSKLHSQFRLTYNMILNLLRVQDFKVEDMIKRSFSEFATQKDVPEMRNAIESLRKDYEAIPPIQCILGEPDIENYYNMYSEIKSSSSFTQRAILSSQSDAHFQAGRVVVYNPKNQSSVFIGCLLGCSIPSGGGGSRQFANSQINRTFRIFVAHEDGTYKIVNSESGDEEIKRICNEKLKIELKSIEAGEAASSSVLVQQLHRLVEEYPLPLGPPALDPITKLKLKSVEFVENYQRLQKLEQLLPESKCHKCPKLSEHFALTENRAKIHQQLAQVTHSASDENLALMPEFQTRLKILRTLGYIDEDNNVLLKGKVSREVNTCEELIVPELIFENFFLALEPAEIVAVLSTMIFHEKDATAPSLTPRLNEARKSLEKLADRIKDMEHDHGLETPTNGEESKILNFGLMEVCYEWAKGMPFHEICRLTNVLEGTIVRAITRIGETCQEVRNCARIIGDTKLYQKMDESIKLIKRDIVFASSLYIV
ncbi:DEAD/DEAH box helicase [Heterostelium album PN500]|uniref:DEAD/DEAH box helicase n=1 Tax=Heterostelium pallidum (strain ATCC 26659 / Pp 5 / PN500) TaxID=670386 RepID=D3B594_HETP5|nr:DEAD/DEAH box helicase [Heterostelium album PN500]EFA83459.1 DEAD/DEAH box helicase [Heterostelium album PN500]|eukprot:XP_020435576.1 DEAD/DEAH box helicase [Heterostelium album PN500]